jgi:hypothetical protein
MTVDRKLKAIPREIKINVRGNLSPNLRQRSVCVRLNLKILLEIVVIYLHAHRNGGTVPAIQITNHQRE